MPNDNRTNEELHRALWRCLAKTGWDKTGWPEWTFNGGSIKAVDNFCFACAECETRCPLCPIKWGVDFCEEANSPYRKWSETYDSDEAKKYAAIIAELPWKEGGWK